MKFVGGYSHKQQSIDEWNFKIELSKYSQLLLDVDGEMLEGAKHQIRCLETGTALMKRCPNCNRLRIVYKKELRKMPPSMRNKLTCFPCHIFNNHKNYKTSLPKDYETWIEKSVKIQPIYEKVYEAWYAEINKGVKEENISISELKALRNQTIVIDDGG